MINKRRGLIISAFVGLLIATGAQAQPAPASTNGAANTRSSRGGGFGRGLIQDSTNWVKLEEIRAQDVDIFPDEKTKTYYMVAAAGRQRALVDEHEPD